MIPSFRNIFFRLMLTVLTALLSSEILSASVTSDIDSLVRVLDDAISRRNEYVAVKEGRISSLRDTLAAAGDDGKRFNALGLLYDEYISYDADSALAMADRRLELARGINHEEFTVHAHLNLANIMTLVGSYKEALEQLDGITLATVPDYLVPYYFHIKRLLYGNLTDYSLRPSDRDLYRELTNRYRDSLLSVNDPLSGTYALIKGDAYNEAGDYENALSTINEYLDRRDVSDHEKAMFAYTLSESYHSLGDTENEKINLLISSISDLRSGVREYISMRKLAVILYSEGDIERAYQLMRICLEDAVSSRSRQRIFEINEVFPLVNEVYINEIHAQHDRLVMMCVVIAVLVIFLAVAVIYVYKQMRLARRATRQVARSNEELRQLNDELTEANSKLSRANDEISEHSHVKNEYIGRYMERSLQSIDTLATYRKRLRKMLVAGQIDKAIATLDSDDAIDDEHKKFYADFDRTFLKLFPTFIEEFNALLDPAGRCVVKNENSLTTELRVYALIRLGITDSVKIAKFLGYSVTTIYNYRTKVRNKALGDRALLEEKVMNIGK